MNTSKQLTDLIKNKAKSTGLDAQLLLKRYFMEQMLERIAKSKYRNNLVLKGGLLISSVIGFTARTTQDIDVSVINTPLDKETVKKMFSEICTIDAGDNIVFELVKIQDIHEEFEYPGIRLSFKVGMDKIIDSLKIDITTGDVITPKEIVYGYVTLFEDRYINVFSYPLETILAEKTESILSKNVFGTRMRDFYDVCVLYNVFKDRINKVVLSNAIRNTCAKRKTLHVLNNADTIVVDIEKDEGQKELWKNYVKKNTYAKNITFENALESLKDIIAII